MSGIIVIGFILNIPKKVCCALKSLKYSSDSQDISPICFSLVFKKCSDPMGISTGTNEEGRGEGKRIDHVRVEFETEKKSIEGVAAKSNRE